MSTPKVFVMIGPNGSGKTTYARSVLEAAVRVSKADIARMMSEVYSKGEEGFYRATQNQIILSALYYERDVVIDDTNLTASERKRFFSLLDGVPANLVAVVMDTPSKKVKQWDRKVDRVRHGLSVGVDEIDRQLNSLELPTEQEKFTEVITFDPTKKQDDEG